MSSTLISIADLHALPAESRVVVDCRHSLNDGNYGRAAYATSHISGAYFLHLDDDLSGEKTGSNGRHPLPDAAHLAVRLAQLGIHPHTQVVAYDDMGGMFAARLWWLLRWLGHEKVALLDGGWQAWQAAGLPTDAVVPDDHDGEFAIQPSLEQIVDVKAVLTNLDNPCFTLVDARAANRFAGQDETMDPVGGHIPGAMNRCFQLNLAGSGQFKSGETLRAEWLALLGDCSPEALVCQCGSGVTACHNVLALRVAGLLGSRLYPGSWSEWCADAARPVAVG